MKYKCKCPPNSPFHWKSDKSPTIFQDKSFSQSAFSSAGATMRVEQMRAEGKGIIKGISKDREAEILRIRTYTTFARAIPSN